MGILKLIAFLYILAESHTQNDDINITVNFKTTGPQALESFNLGVEGLSGYFSWGGGRAT